MTYLEAPDDKALFPCARQKSGDEAKPNGIDSGNKAEKLQEQLVGGIVKR